MKGNKIRKGSTTVLKPNANWIVTLFESITCFNLFQDFTVLRVKEYIEYFVCFTHLRITRPKHFLINFSEFLIALYILGIPLHVVLQYVAWLDQ